MLSLHKSRDGIILLDQFAKVMFVNSQVQPLLNLKTQIEKKSQIEQALRDRPEIVQFLKKALLETKVVSLKIASVYQGKPLEGLLEVTPFHNRFGLVFGWLIRIYDFTEPVLSDRLLIWSKSVQRLAHDIKTPLSSVSLNLKALKMRLDNEAIPDQDDINDDIQMMQNELERVHKMTTQFLKFVNLDKPRLQIVQMKEVVYKAIRKFSSLLNGALQIETEISEDAERIWADPNQIELVLHIIIENAIDAMRGSGLIKINCTLAQYLDKRFAEYAALEITDAGPGMDPTVLDKIFEPYFSTKKSGTGIGLSIAKKIIEDHGGEIDVFSKLNLGSTFRISLPLLKDDINETQNSGN